MKKSFKIFFLICILISIYIITNPIRKSDNKIRKYLFQKIPIGTSIEKVRAYVNKKDWNKCNIDNKISKVYYGCEFISYGDICEINGGKIIIKNESINCVLNNKLLTLNEDICVKAEGNWVLIGSSNRCISNKLIKTYLGEYLTIPLFPFITTTVIANWKFDKEKRLTDIVISKEVNGL